MPDIQIVPYDAEWPRQFEDERARLQAALGALAVRIDHHGSTAVPGLAAKPIIDIQISVARLHPIDAYAPALAALGYVHVPHEDDARCPYFHRPASWPHRHHVHVVQAGSEEERRTIVFRDHLRRHADAAREYEWLKRDAASRFPASASGSHEAYARAKSAFVESMIEAATIASYYDATPEETRLAVGPSQLERERTKEILSRHLPPAPATIVDVGGAAGVYSVWLAELGYDVHLVDLSPRLVEEARRRNAPLARRLASIEVGDARRLPHGDASADVVLVMGPLYHLTAGADRARALDEAFRVLRTPGFVAVAAISRAASALDGLARELTFDPAFLAMRDRDLTDGQHRNDTHRPDYFTTAYFHRPDELRDEMIAAGFEQPRVVGVEGPGWILPDFDARWNDAARRDLLLDAARALEAEPSVVGASAHLLGLGWRRAS